MAASRAFPEVQGRCPACGGQSLFLGSGGYVTCSRIECPDPTAADDLLHLAGAHGPDTHRPPTCGLVTPGVVGRYLGPCIRAPHDDHVHQDATGARWWPVDGAVVTAPPTMTDEEVAELRARWSATAGRHVAITVIRGEV